MAVIASLVALLAVLVLVATMRPFPIGGVVNGWVEARLAERLAERSLSAHVGALDVSFRSGLVPVIAARDIELRQVGTAVPLVFLSDAEIVLHRGDAALGHLAPKALRLSGMQVTAITSEESLSLDLGDAHIVPAVSTPGELIGVIQSIFAHPVLAGLEEIGLTGFELRAEDRTNGWTWQSRSGDVRISRARETLKIDATISDLGEIYAPGSLSLSLAADLDRGTGSVKVAGRGVNPAQFLPSDGARVNARALAVDAPVSLDLAADILPSGELGPLRGGLSVGAGQIPLPGGATTGLEALSAKLHIAHGLRHMSVSDLYLRSDRLSFDGDAQVILSETPLGVLRSAALHVSLRDVWVAPGIGLDRAVDADYLDAAIEYHRPTGKITLGSSYLVTDGEAIELSGYLIPPAQPTFLVQQINFRPEPGTEHTQSRKLLPDGWQAGLDLAAKTVSVETALSLWPTGAGPGTRKWALQNLFTGDLSDARLSIRLDPVGKPNTGLTFRFEDVSAWGAPKFPAFETGSGFFSLQDRRLAVQVETATLPLSQSSRIALRDALIVKSDVRQKEEPLAISGHADATAAQVLTMLQLPLFHPKNGARQPMPLQPEDAEGEVSLDLALNIPMGPNRREKRVSFAGQGMLWNAKTDALLPGRTLQSDRMAVELTQDQIALYGPVMLDGMPAEARWEKPLGPGAKGSLISVNAPLSQTLAASFGVPIRPQEMQGAGQAAARVVLNPGRPPELDLTADLTGASFSVPGLGWSKRADRGGTLELSGRLGETPRFDTLRLEAPGLLVDGSLQINAGNLAELDFDRLRIGRWIDAPVELRPDGGRRLSIAMTGGRVDLRHLPKSKGGENPLGTAQIRGSRVIINDNLAMTGVSGTVDLQRGGAGTLSAQINGQAPVSVRLDQAEKGTSIRVESSNAGAAARAAGLFAQGSGGNMRLTLTPTGASEQYYGKLRVEDLTITEAPVATSLLSAISLVGLAEQIGTGGLHFGRVDAAFLLTPDAVVVSESSATGPSLGVSLDGKLDLKAKTMDMQGVLSPFYFVNRMGSGLTRRGEGLFGFAFRLNGPFKDPEIRSNPLSFLTPGMFREIFRRDPPDIRAGAATQ